MDAVVYGTLISLGFATFENYEYVYVYFDNIPPLQIAIVRALTAIQCMHPVGLLWVVFLECMYFEIQVIQFLKQSYIQYFFTVLIII